MRTIVVATRQSALAVTQTGMVVDQLRRICKEHGIECEFEIRKFVTKGDRILDVTLSKVGGKGLFVKEIEQALLEGEADIAIHSMKDMPFELPDGLMIGAIPEREDARDCLITRDNLGFEDLPSGSVVGTSSLRRECQLRNIRPDLQIESIRGNIDSRIKKLEMQQFDAIVLAAAGLKRMGWEERISAYLQPDLCVPAVGQGALCVECRSDDDFVLRLLGLLQHEPTALAVRAERAFLGTLEGGCQVPIGAHAVMTSSAPGTVSAPKLQITGIVGTPDGVQLLRVMQTGEGSNPESLGISIAEQLLSRGADRILDSVRK